MSIAGITQTEDSTLLQLDGVIDIGRGAELKALLLKALASGRAVRVSLDAVEDLDVTAFQLLWAAEREAGSAGQPFQISDNRRGASWNSLMGVGLDSTLMELSLNSGGPVSVSRADER